MKDQQGEAAGSIRQEIGGILTTLNTAFDNLRNDLLTDTALDISARSAPCRPCWPRTGWRNTNLDHKEL